VHLTATAVCSSCRGLGLESSHGFIIIIIIISTRSLIESLLSNQYLYIYLAYPMEIGMINQIDVLISVLSNVICAIVEMVRFSYFLCV